MKGIFIKLSTIFALFFCHTHFAAGGFLFNISPHGSNFDITTTIPKKEYTKAGIQVKTPGCRITSGCTPITNGYCIFATNNVDPATIAIDASSKNMCEAILCLNGYGPLSCQKYNLKTRATFIIVGNSTPAPLNNVLTFPATGFGNLVPTYNINGNETQLNVPIAVYLDSSDHLWVSNTGEPSVSMFPFPSTGNVAPLKTISGPNTTFSLFGPVGIGKDAIGNLYVADFNNNSISIFAPTANGNVAPIRQIIGANTQLDSPENIVVKPTGEVFVVNASETNNSPSLLEFAAGANGNVSPIRNISGSNTLFQKPTGLWIDSLGNFWVTDSAPPYSILEFPPNANGNVAPIRTISGPDTLLQFPYGVAIDAQGYIYEVGGVYINVFSPKASGNATPVQTITGANTTLEFSAGITIR